MNKALLYWGFTIFNEISMTENSSIHAPAEELSIAGKYFSLKKEQRINRMQFFVRNIIGILVWFLFMLWVFVLIQISIFLFKWSLNRSIFWMIFAFMPLITIIPLLYIFCINTCKRAHDLNHHWIWYLLWYFLGPLILDFLLYIIFFITGFAIGVDHMDHVIWSFVNIYVIVYMLPLILLGILQFRPGSQHKNKYGPAPTGKPLV